jgi:hypothetical protein
VSFLLRSNDGVSSLRLSCESADFLAVEVIGRDLRATCRLETFQPAERLSDYFGQLADNWRGWSGLRSWSALTGELSLDATIDRAGHVTLVALLLYGAPAAWSVSAVFTVDAGQLESLASQARTLEASAASLKGTSAERSR